MSDKDLHSEVSALHISFRNSLIKREENFFSQLAFLITGVGGYFATLVSGKFTDIWVLFFVTVGTLLLNGFIYIIGTYTGYQYRCDLLQLLKIEEKLGITSYTLSGWPKYCSFEVSIKPPNIVQVFQKAYIVFSVLVILISTVYACKNHIICADKLCCHTTYVQPACTPATCCRTTFGHTTCAQPTCAPAMCCRTTIGHTTYAQPTCAPATCCRTTIGHTTNVQPTCCFFMIFSWILIVLLLCCLGKLIHNHLLNKMKNILDKEKGSRNSIIRKRLRESRKRVNINFKNIFSITF